jgi:CheY-like chemotaxis protein
MSINKVCIIDDDEIYTSVVRKIIFRSGLAADAIFFPNGQDAIDFFQANFTLPETLPDMILLDINMPVLDGWQFLDIFTEINPHDAKKIPIFIVSSSIDEKDYLKAKSYREVVDYIVKPVNIDSLKKIFDKVSGYNLASG